MEDSRKDESMGGVLQEAAKMLRSLSASQGVKKVDERNDRLDDLQKQLNGLRSGSLKRAQVNAQGRWSDGGLLDLGATHPLRARQEGEDIENLDEIDVALAGGEMKVMRITEGGIIVQENEGVGSIIPLGLLVERLHCVVTWDGDECRVVHPELGALRIHMDGCPYVTQRTATKLLGELEKKGKEK